MKRLKGIIWAALIGLALFGAVVTPVLAQTYYADISAVNTTATDYDMLALMCNLNTNYLVDNGYITATGLDTLVEAGACPHMLAFDRLLYARGMDAGASSLSEFTMGNTPISAFYILTGYDGYITTLDNAQLELGNDFEIEISGYVDTSAGADKNLIYKEGAFKCDISADESISAGLPAFPTVAAVNGGIEGSSSTNHTINLPGGIEVGDLLLVFLASDGNPTITFPGGWNELFNVANGTEVRFGCWYREADGSEGATITVTTSVNEATAHTSYRINGYPGTPEAQTATGSSQNPDPPNLAPSWGTEKTLWIAAEGNDYNRYVTAYPTNYTDGRCENDGSILECSVGSARRNLEANSENPGTFTLHNTDGWVAATVAIPQSFGGVTAVNVGSGEHTVETWTSGGNLYISVDGAVAGDWYDSVALGGASVPDTANNWIIGQNNVMPYIEYIKITTPVGGSSEKLWYQPNDYIRGEAYTTGTATFTNGSDAVVGAGTSWTDDMEGSIIWSATDLVSHTVDTVTDATNLVLTANYSAAGGAGHSYVMAPRMPDRDTGDGYQDGAITWGLNPTGVSVYLGGLTPYEGDGGGGAVAPPDVGPEITTPEGMYPGEEAMQGTGVPWLYPIVSDVADRTDTPIVEIWWLMCAIFTLAFMAAVHRYVPNMLLTGVSGIAALGLCVAMAFLPAWFIILAVLFIIGMLVMERTPAV